MPGRFHNGMELLDDGDVARIHDITDRLRLDRDWIVIPLATSAAGVERVLPDGKLLLRPPGERFFEAWLWALPGRLRELPLGRIPRVPHPAERAA